MNKKGDVQSLIIATVILFVIGIFFLFTNRLVFGIYDEFDSYFQEKPQYNNTEAHVVIKEVKVYEHSMWDYGFLGIALGYILMLALFAYSTRTDAAFYWIYAIVSVIGMIVAVLLSNTWQEMASSDAMSSTIGNFPITNAILGTYYPTVFLAIIVLTMILLFGKPREGA